MAEEYRDTDRRQGRRSAGRFCALVLLSCAALLLAALLGLVLGASGVGAGDVWALATGGELAAKARSILVSIRIPRVIAGVLAGAAFSVSGALIQEVLDNPLASPYTLGVDKYAASSLIPSLGLGSLFSNNKYVTIAIPLAIVIAIVVMVVLNKTRFGYELKATGNNKNAAKYCGMAEKRNIILTLIISGGLAAMGAAMLYLTGYEQWNCSTSSVPGMGFNGIAAAFLGGLHPIGTILASFFIQHITAGGAYVDKTMYCAQISDLISAIIIYLCGFVLFMKYAMNRGIARREEKAAARVKEKEPADNGKGGDQ